MAERVYPAVERPILTSGTLGLPPARLPCVECPLARAAIKGALGGYTVAQYLEVLRGPADLACHLSKGFPHEREFQRSCTGVAMYRANTKYNTLGNALRAALIIGPNRDLVFANEREFAEHHNGK